MSEFIGKYLVCGGGELAPSAFDPATGQQINNDRVPYGVFSYIQLWNPAGSGVNVHIDVIEIMNGLAPSDVLFYRTQTPTTYKGKWWTVQPPIVNGQLELRAGISTTHIHPYPSEDDTDIFYQRWLPTSGFWKKAFKSPIVIPPGWGVNAEHTVRDNALMLNVEGRQIAI